MIGNGELKRELPDKRALTEHARQRMLARGIPPSAVAEVLKYGRSVFVRGARVFALGRKEIAKHAPLGVNLARLEGIQVVCRPESSGAIVTVYRNRNFRGLRPKGRSRFQPRRRVRQ